MDFKSFAKIVLQFICIQPVKSNLHFALSGYLKFCHFFPHIYNGMSKGFSKMYVLSFSGEKTFLRTFFYYITGFCKKKYNFCYFLHILKVKQRAFQWCINCHISTSNMWFWEGGGGQINPSPPSVYWFLSTPAGIGLKSIN